MKTRTLVLVFLLTAVVFVAGSCATDKMAYISKEYEIYGTWVNPDANPVLQRGKIVIHPNGKMEWYHIITSTSFTTVEIVITNKWIDSTGDIWYTFILDWGELYSPYYDYFLCKISDSGKTLELVVSNSDYPKEIDPSAEYHILYRQ